MRQKRAKTYRRLMSLYCLTFGFRQPYQVLVDSEMCRAATELKVDLGKQLSAVLQGTVKPMITQCCIHELYLQGKSMQPAVDLAKSFERRKCNHREAIPGEECLASVVADSNTHRYVIATPSQILRAKLRQIPAVPIVHINRTVMVLEPPSDVTLKTKQQAEEQALHPTSTELNMTPLRTTSKPPRQKREPKGPNPLSVKKKVTPRADVRMNSRPGSASDNAATGKKRKRSEDDESGATAEKRKRRRKRKRTVEPLADA
ncbi:Fcf1-domain-containing protein [Phlebopus sp. FC_14]|nr:Fcf1-domain-containing protein [Phlebopus sp. FC_14]